MLNKQIAIHEAGHAVVAHALGIEGLRIVKNEHGFACGMEIPEELGPLEEWALAVVSAGGAAAESVAGLAPGDGGDDDWAHVCEHVAAWAGLDDVPEADDVFELRLRRACDTAIAIVKHRWDIVEAISELLLARGGELDDETLLAELDQC